MFSIEIEMDAEVSLGEFCQPCPGISGRGTGGKMAFHWLGNLDVALHGISVDLDVTVNLGDANNLSLAALDNQLRPSATIVATGSGS